MRKLLTALFVMLIAAGPAAAQDYKPIDVNVGFGWMFPTSDFKNSFDAGWNGTIGLTFNITETVGVMADYTYGRMNGPDRTVFLTPTPTALTSTSGIIQSNHQMHVGTFDLVYKAQNRDRAINGYVLGGGGIYHRIVQLTSPAVGYTTICDPFWYVCYPGAVAVDQILGDRSSNDFGINIGGGLVFGTDAKFYIESRYHYVWGKTVTPANSSVSTSNCGGGTCTANAAYFPLTFGFKW